MAACREARSTHDPDGGIFFKVETKDGIIFFGTDGQGQCYVEIVSLSEVGFTLYNLEKWCAETAAPINEMVRT